MALVPMGRYFLRPIGFPADPIEAVRVAVTYAAGTLLSVYVPIGCCRVRGAWVG